MIRKSWKCFNEEVNVSNKNCKVNGSAVCFLYNIFFLCCFYSRSLYCFNQLYPSGKSGWLWKKLVAGWLWKEPVVKWCAKWSRKCHMRSSKWPLSAWTQVSSLVCHWSMIHHALLELTPCLNQLLSQINFFCILLGSAVTLLRWSGQICSQLVSNFLRSLCTENYWNRFIFDRVIPKIRRGTFFWDIV